MEKTNRMLSKNESKNYIKLQNKLQIEYQKKREKSLMKIDKQFCIDWEALEFEQTLNNSLGKCYE